MAGACVGISASGHDDDGCWVNFDNEGRKKICISLFSLFSEIIESGGIGGAGAAGRLGVSARVEFARMLLGASWEGGGLRFAIAGGCRARLVVNVKSCLFLRAVVRCFSRFSIVLASRAVAVIMFS